MKMLYKFPFLVISFFHVIPDGKSIWNDGIHMDSRWDGMAEMAVIPAKTYSIWNGWNPYGFHVENGGRVKTSTCLASGNIKFYLNLLNYYLPHLLPNK